MSKARIININGNKVSEREVDELLNRIKAHLPEDMIEEIEEDEEEISHEEFDNFVEFLNFLSGISNEDENECDECDTCEHKDECDSIKLSIKDRLDQINTQLREEENNDIRMRKENERKELSMLQNKKSNEYDFLEMIKEFSEGYNGLFTDGEDIYTYTDGTLLYKTEVGVFPVMLTPHLLTSKFSKVEVFISNSKALELAIEGQAPKFVVDLYGTTYRGHLTMKNGIPSYTVHGEIIGSHEAIVLGALVSGQWYL